MSRLAVLLCTLLVPAALTAQDESWVQDFAKAKGEAKAAKKHLLVDFTGSDWCGWCIKLDKEVFSQEAFKTDAPKNFVLVKLDYPQNQDLVTAEIRAQNETLQQQFEIQGFPTILLMDAEGRPYAKTGYAQGGPEKYLSALAEMKKKGDAFEAAMLRADARKDIERAKALDDALTALDAEVVDGYHLATMQEIVKLDADGTANLKGKYEAKCKDLAEAKAIQTEMRSLQEMLGPLMQNGEGDTALAKLDEIIKAPKTPGQHQVALFFKGMVIMDTSGDTTAALEALDAAKALKPESMIGKQVDRIVPQIKKQAEKKG